MGAVIPGRSTSIVRLDPPWLTGLSFDDVNAVVFRGSDGCCGIASSGCCDVSAPRGTVFEATLPPIRYAKTNEPGSLSRADRRGNRSD
jgi:hypothetical protein